ncbi:hypothetical protein MASR2M78_29540 [Treponema sp.]
MLQGWHCDLVKLKTIGDKVLLEGQDFHKLRLHEDRIAAQAFQAVLRTAKGAPDAAQRSSRFPRLL